MVSYWLIDELHFTSKVKQEYLPGPEMEQYLWNKFFLFWRSVERWMGSLSLLFLFSLLQTVSLFHTFNRVKRKLYITPIVLTLHFQGQ